jgi:hypothetical protein
MREQHGGSDKAAMDVNCDEGSVEFHSWHLGRRCKSEPRIGSILFRMRALVAIFAGIAGKETTTQRLEHDVCHTSWSDAPRADSGC